MDTEAIPLLGGGETALSHAIRLVRDEQTGGALVVTADAIDLFRSPAFRVVVQRYPREVDALGRFEARAAAAGGTVRRVEPVTGVVGNYWIGGAGGADGGWAWPPEGDVDEVVTPMGVRFRVESQPCVLGVVEGAAPAALGEFYRGWVDPWQTPVLLLTGDGGWPAEGGEPPGEEALANVARDTHGSYFVTYSKPSAAAFSRYHRYRIRVNGALSDFLPA